MSLSFRGASAEAVHALTGELEAAVSGSPDVAARVARDLFTVADTIRSEGSLRRFATDASLPAQAKSGLVGQVFGGRVDERSQALLESAFGRRWTAGRDLADALEHLGVVALVRSAGDDVARLADELFAFAQAVKDNPSLRDALSDPARSVEDKRALVHGLLAGKAVPATVALAEQSLAGTHRTVGAALHEYQKVVADVHGERVATVRVARDLSEAERQRLHDALSRQYGRSVHLNVLVDPSVIGGIRVEIGDDVIDGTVSSRLDDARRRLVG
jgi:F-type H+-transporting ATPase subunit delta